MLIYYVFINEIAHINADDDLYQIAQILRVIFFASNITV